MSAPTDPDTEDRRPDRDREPFAELDERDPYDDEDERLDEVLGNENQLGLFDDELLELSLDDLKDMDGPDA